MGNRRDELFGGYQAEYCLDLDTYFEDGAYYFNNPNGATKITDSEGGTKVTFPDGNSYWVTHLDGENIEYIDSSGTKHSQTIAETREQFKQFSVNGDTVTYRGKEYKVGDTIPAEETNGLKRDIKIVGIDEDGNLQYKTTWGSGASYHEDQYKNEYAEGEDAHIFTVETKKSDSSGGAEVTDATPEEEAALEDAIKDEKDKKGDAIKPAVSITEEKDKWTSRADGYQTENTSTADRNRGIGSSDNGNVGDQDRALVDYEDSPYADRIADFNDGDGTIHAGEGISHHHHQTMTDNYTYNGTQVTYLPGQVFDLASDPTKLSEVDPFREMYESNRENNVLGDAFNPEANGKGWSQVEYAAALASSGKYSFQDAMVTAQALANPPEGSGRTAVEFADYEGPWYDNTPLQEFSEDPLMNKNFDEIEKKLYDKVGELQDKWKKIHSILEGLSGEAKNAADFYTAQCIQGKYEVAMGNINDRLKPMCAAICLLNFNGDASKFSGIKLPQAPAALAEFKTNPPITLDTPVAKQVKMGEEAVKNLIGNGPSPVTRNKMKIEKEIEDEETKLKSWKEAESKNGSRPPDDMVSDFNPVTHEKVGEHNANADAQDAWDTNNTTIQAGISACDEKLGQLNRELDAVKAQIKSYQSRLTSMMVYANTLLDFIKKYDTFTDTFARHVGASGYEASDVYNMIMRANETRDMSELTANHDAIVAAFEDYKDMPVISNKSDYRKGDVVLYDDAHGYVYAVTEEFDPFTGTLKIACFTKDGRRIGSDITVWDQREIVPVRGIRDIEGWHEYETVPDTFDVDQTIPGTRPQPPQTDRGTLPPGGGTPEEPKTTNPPPTDITTNPPHITTNPPHITTNPPHITTNPPPVNTQPKQTTPGIIPTTPGPSATIPEIPIYTIPESNIPGGGGSSSGGSVSPHTGLDAIYGTGDTKQSAAGLGALAGLAAGAAGLGLTGLIGDKKDEDEEDEEKEESSQKIENQKIEEKPAEENNSNPLFF